MGGMFIPLTYGVLDFAEHPALVPLPRSLPSLDDGNLPSPRYLGEVIHLQDAILRCGFNFSSVVFV